MKKRSEMILYEGRFYNTRDLVDWLQNNLAEFTPLKNVRTAGDHLNVRLSLDDEGRVLFDAWTSVPLPAEAEMELIRLGQLQR